MNSRKYDRVDIDLSDKMASSKLHLSRGYFMRYEHILICLYLCVSVAMAGLFWHNVRPFIPIKSSKRQMNIPLVLLMFLYNFDKPSGEFYSS